MKQTTEGIVLRDYKLDDDRILTILTREQGVLTAYANGANRLRSALASSTELLCYSQFVLFTRRGRNVVDNADAIHTFFGIRADLEKLALASYFAQLATELSPRGEPAQPHLSLLLNTLHYLENGRRESVLLKPLFELRLLTLGGYMPPLVACRECGSYEGAFFHFFPSDGSLLCDHCAGDNLPGGVPLAMGVLAAMRHIIYAPAPKLFSFTLSNMGLRQLERASEDYLRYQVEKTFHSLEMYKSLQELSVKPTPDENAPQ